jgi:cation:H+ antiporter
LLLGAIFMLAAAVSIGASWMLVANLERVGTRLGLSEALLGMLAALAADAPEITAAVTALVRHDPHIGVGVVIGSNVFNLAALLGLAGVVAGEVVLHRRVIELAGVVALWICTAALAVVTGVLSPLAGLLAVLVVLAPYMAILGVRHERLTGL